MYHFLNTWLQCVYTYSSVPQFSRLPVFFSYVDPHSCCFQYQSKNIPTLFYYSRDMAGALAGSPHNDFTLVWKYKVSIWYHYWQHPILLQVLRFDAYFKQTVHESPNEYYRIRDVKIYYYLEDDSISVVEPVLENRWVCPGGEAAGTVAMSAMS